MQTSSRRWSSKLEEVVVEVVEAAEGEEEEEHSEV